MKGGQFREDLFYRINTITVHLPAMRRDRARRNIGLLAQHFLTQHHVLGQQAA